jgi:hypothetical protein
LSVLFTKPLLVKLCRQLSPSQTSSKNPIQQNPQKMPLAIDLNAIPVKKVPTPEEIAAAQAKKQADQAAKKAVLEQKRAEKKADADKKKAEKKAEADKKKAEKLAASQAAKKVKALAAAHSDAEMGDAYDSPVESKRASAPSAPKKKRSAKISEFAKMKRQLTGALKGLERYRIKGIVKHKKAAPLKKSLSKKASPSHRSKAKIIKKVIKKECGAQCKARDQRLAHILELVAAGKHKQIRLPNPKPKEKNQDRQFQVLFNPKMIAWRVACAEAGYLKSGEKMKNIPSKDEHPVEHAALVKKQQELYTQWAKAGKIPVQYIPAVAPDQQEAAKEYLSSHDIFASLIAQASSSSKPSTRSSSRAASRQASPAKSKKAAAPMSDDEE